MPAFLASSRWTVKLVISHFSYPYPATTQIPLIAWDARLELALKFFWFSSYTFYIVYVSIYIDKSRGGTVAKPTRANFHPSKLAVTSIPIAAPRALKRVASFSLAASSIPLQCFWTSLESDCTSCVSNQADSYPIIASRYLSL